MNIVRVKEYDFMLGGHGDFEDGNTNGIQYNVIQEHFNNLSSYTDRCISYGIFDNTADAIHKANEVKAIASTEENIILFTYIIMEYR